MDGSMPAASVSQPRSGARSGARPGARTAARPRGERARAADPGMGARVRWDRVGRVALLVVMGVLVYLYMSTGMRMFSTWRQAHSDRASVATLRHEHQALISEREALGRRGTLEVEARSLNMRRPGEQAYVIRGLPND